MNTLKKILLTLTFSTLGVAFTSSATPIVTDWDFVVDTAFTAHTPGNPDVVGSNNNGEWAAPTTLTWGTDIGNGQSSLDVSSGNNGFGSTMGSLMTNGASAITATLEHDNNVIRGSSLDTAILSTQIFLDPIAPANPYALIPGFIPPALSFNVNFSETPNAGTCADATSPVKCNDIFVINLLGAAINGITYNPITNTLSQVFSIFEHSYRAEIKVDGLGTLADPVCTAAGAQLGCVGITTVENQLNSFDVSLRIALVPEPSSILLLSLALFGIFASMRNKHI